LDADHDALAVDRKLPAIKQPRRLPKQDAPEILQVPRLTRSAILVDELRRADDDERSAGVNRTATMSISTICANRTRKS